jgi:hypothetical protein
VGTAARTRAADDFATIRARMQELRREREGGGGSRNRVAVEAAKSAPGGRISPVVISIRRLRNAAEHGSEVPATQYYSRDRSTCFARHVRFHDWLGRSGCNRGHLAKRRTPGTLSSARQAFRPLQQIPHWPVLALPLPAAGLRLDPESAGRVIRAAGPG